MNNPHDWVPSTLGHGETMCKRCMITNREAAVLDVLNECDVPRPEPRRKETYAATGQPLPYKPADGQWEND